MKRLTKRVVRLRKSVSLFQDLTILFPFSFPEGETPETALTGGRPMPGAKPDKYETGKPSTGRPSFTAFRRRAGVFMSAVSSARARGARTRGKQGKYGKASKKRVIKSHKGVGCI
jgi:hypothetical protein